MGGSASSSGTAWALHVGTHQGPVRIIMLQERNQTGRNADHLAGSHVDELDLLAGDHHKVGVIASHHATGDNRVVLNRFVGRGNVAVGFLIGAKPHDFVGKLAVLHLAVRRDQKSVVVDRGVHRQTRDQTDVRPFWRFDRADTTVVGNVDVAHFKAGPLTIQTAGAQCRQAAFVRQHRQRVGLVDHLREFATAEEVFNRGGDAFRVDQTAGRHVVGVFETHPLLHGAAKLEETLADFVARQLVDGS